ncbi:MAG TPA: DNA polymerase/3'-5' exonuclease PolX [Phycisphaerae bacterium]|nr:DNA polymerase/3'-5' exonuclease PolX [Phycisphaerae bacterium]
MKNKEIAGIFSGIADLMEILGEDRFRINSYRRSARVVSDLADDIAAVAEAGRLTELPGVGKSTAEKIQEFLTTGKVTLHEELLAKVPPQLQQLLAVPGLGPKTAAKLWKQASITSLAELRQAIEKDDPRLTEVEGLGAKKIRQLWEGVSFMESSGGRILLDDADARARELVEAISRRQGAGRVTAAGSLRRGKETIGDIDLLCQAPQSAAGKIIAAFTEAPAVKRVLAKGSTKASVVLDGEVQADLRVVPKRSFGAALQYFSGSKEHNVRLREIAVKKGLKLNEYGLFAGSRQVAGSDEDGIYERLGLCFVPPELREDRGEVEAALEGKLPALIEFSDISGDLHMHTTASDGRNTIDEMIQACRDRGYEYMCISEHSKSQIQANGLDEKRLAAHAEAVRKAAGKYRDIRVLVGIEVDIFKDGELDFEADVLEELDFVTASPHTALSLGRKEATKRIIAAIEHPCVHCIGHPSGRLINSRPGMEIDIDAIAAAAAANNVALEINAHPMRLDLRDVHVRAALQAGAKLVINTDAHIAEALDLMKYGVITARRGWAEPKDVINTYSTAELKKWIGGR